MPEYMSKEDRVKWLRGRIERLESLRAGRLASQEQHKKRDARDLKVIATLKRRLNQLTGAK